jgi:vanillate O-demethylase monooxygenase subunit
MPAGAGKDAALERKVLNLITPETPTSSHYFWSIVRGFRLNDPALDEIIRDGIVRTFDQDKAVLEAQQRALGPDPDNVTFPVAIRVDAGPIQGRKLVAAMLAREATAGGNVERMKASS